MLLAAGAEVDHASNDGETALILAAQGGHVEVIQALVTAGADPHRANNSGHTPLAAAEHEAAAQALVQAGATA
jgi:ankyrin repeat protein